MNSSATIKRTTATDPDFISLIQTLDNELWNELNEDQATYDQYNKVPNIKTVILIYVSGKAIACGCFKETGPQFIEIKRMFVRKEFRGKGYSKIILEELERWAKELGYSFAVLETSIHFVVAKKLYQSNGYVVIDNYPPYVGLDESVCMRKDLRIAH